jgi:hypothetical protein
MEAGAAIESRVLVPSAPCEPRATGGAIAKDLTARFPELAKAIRAMRPDALILDGEVAVCDEQLVSRFEDAPPAAGPSGHPPMLKARGPGRAPRATRIRRERVERVYLALNWILPNRISL